MSVLLWRGAGSVSRFCTTVINVRRAASTKSELRGLILGAYNNDEQGFTLTKSAQNFDQTEDCRLSKALERAHGIKEGRTHTFWGLSDSYPTVVVVGMGKQNKGYDDIENICQDRETARVSAAAGYQVLQQEGIKQIFCEGFDHPECAAEGVHLGAFKFDDFRHKKSPDDNAPPSVCFYNTSKKTPAEDEWQQGEVNAHGQNLARTLAELPANKLTPCIFGERVRDLFSKHKNVDVQVHDDTWITEQRMGALLSVAAGSCEPPRFVELTYCGGEPDDGLVVLVGKGVTFDSGGVSIKPSAKMQEMRADMGGAACVVGALHILAAMNARANVKCLIPLTENMCSGTATKPGDVVTAMNGKTIAVDNTDAEGRLILADALCYAERFQPELLLDMATLTGAIGVALGKSACGVFTNSNALYDELQKAGAHTGDRVWRMPLWRMFSKAMTDYKAYDLNNVGKAQGGGACSAAAFLREFVPKDTPWMHLDIASVMFPDDPIPYLKGMTGRPTRTVVDFIMRSRNKKQC